MNDEIIIRRAETPADYRACQDAQRRAWGLADESYVVPIATMVGAQLHGGLVLGAFLPSGEAVGVSFAFLGKIEGRLCLYSQLTGIVPSHQGQGIGSRLKYAQRDYCLQEGLPVIAWAFDPMQAGNARFNLARLGATSRRLVFDMYGPRTDALNAGVPTDRLIAEWELDATPREAPPSREWQALPRVLHPTGEASLCRILKVDAPRVLVQIPRSFSVMRNEHRGFAETWRGLASHVLDWYFERGYRAVGFVEEGDERRGEPGSFYVLEREPRV